MNKHISISTSEDPIELPDHLALLELADAVRELMLAFRARAQTTCTRGDWGAVEALESAAYYLWGAMGYIAQEEGAIPS